MSEENTLLDTEATTEAPAEDQVETTEQSAEADAAEQLLAGKYKTAEDLESAYKSLESKIGEKEDAIRERLKEEMSQPKEGVPLSAGEYELPDFVDESEAVGNEALKSWSEHCFENGYSNEEFQKGLELYMNSMPQEPDLEKRPAILVTTQLLGLNLRHCLQISSSQKKRCQQLSVCAKGLMVSLRLRQSWQQ